LEDHVDVESSETGSERQKHDDPIVTDENSDTQPLTSDESTHPDPEKEAEQIMEKSNLSPTLHPEIVKELTAFRVLSEQVSTAPKNIQVEILSPVRGKQTRCASLLSRRIGIHRQNILKKRPSRAANMHEKERKRALVVNFMKNPENSTPLPGKKDATANMKMKYALNDNITNLHRKFIEEHPTVKISRTVFARFRPEWMKLIHVAARRQCLCVYHRNGQLKLKSIKQKCSVNQFLQNNTNEKISEMLNGLPAGNIQLSQWQKETVNYKGNLLKKMRLNHLDLSRDEFIESFKEDFGFLRDHIRRIKTQYMEINNLRNSLAPNQEITCQMDYAENYNCVFQDEPSQVYYDRRQITLHPMVIHFRDVSGSLVHRSYVGISGYNNHSASTTLAFIQKLIPELLKLLPNLNTIHYITDSPASQYRNKSIVKLIANHERLFSGVKCTWEFLETGHGKGPCDGVGGAVKKTAETAVKKGAIISCADEFYSWAKNSGGNIEYVFVTEADVNKAEREIKNAQYLKGISSAHSLKAYEGYIYWRETSCFSACCRREPTCPGWMKTSIPVNSHLTPGPITTESNDDNVDTNSANTDNENIHLENIEENDVNNEEESLITTAAGFADSHHADAGIELNGLPQNEVVSSSEMKSASSQKYATGSMVKVMYKRKKYVGKIEDYSIEHMDYYINFMEKRKRSSVYVWPKVNDSIWVRPDNILGEAILHDDGSLQNPH
jgi:hypothetical protein